MRACSARCSLDQVWSSTACRCAVPLSMFWASHARARNRKLSTLSLDVLIAATLLPRNWLSGTGPVGCPLLYEGAWPFFGILRSEYLRPHVLLQSTRFLDAVVAPELDHRL